jgi:hypothetical protein
MSEKSLTAKLLFKPGHQVLIVNPPPNYDTLLRDLPAGVKIHKEPDGQADLVQVFVSSRKELEERLPQVKPSVKPGGLLWVTYPKGTSGAKADINRDSIRAYAQTLGLEAVALVSFDDTWSALRLKQA